MWSLRAEGRPHCETISPFSTCSGQSRPQTLFTLVLCTLIQRRGSVTIQSKDTVTSLQPTPRCGLRWLLSIVITPWRASFSPSNKTMKRLRDSWPLHSGCLTVRAPLCTRTRVFLKAFSPRFSFRMHIQSRVYDLLPVYNNAHSQYTYEIMRCSKKW